MFAAGFFMFVTSLVSMAFFTRWLAGNPGRSMFAAGAFFMGLMLMAMSMAQAAINLPGVRP